MAPKSTGGTDKGGSSGPGAPENKTDKPTKKPFVSKIVDMTEQDAGKAFIIVGGTPTQPQKPKGK